MSQSLAISDLPKSRRRSTPQSRGRLCGGSPCAIPAAGSLYPWRYPTCRKSPQIFRSLTIADVPEQRREWRPTPKAPSNILKKLPENRASEPRKLTPEKKNSPPQNTHFPKETDVRGWTSIRPVFRFHGVALFRPITKFRAQCLNPKTQKIRQTKKKGACQKGHQLDPPKKITVAAK